MPTCSPARSARCSAAPITWNARRRRRARRRNWAWRSGIPWRSHACEEGGALTPRRRTRMRPNAPSSVGLSLELLRVVEQAAIACAQTMGQGDRHASDQAAVESMRGTLAEAPIDGTIVTGEGERDEAPMLYIGEKVGLATRGEIGLPEVDIAVDPLEGTNLCATGGPNALAVLAASESGGVVDPAGHYFETTGGCAD